VIQPPDSRALNTGILRDGLWLFDGDIDEPELAHQVRALAGQHCADVAPRPSRVQRWPNPEAHKPAADRVFCDDPIDDIGRTR
jgi:hypothetical protein